MATAGRAVVSYADYDGEISTFGVRSTTPTAANFDAQVAAFEALQDAAAAITLGLKTQTSLAIVNKVAIGEAADDAAQRELKWLVQYHDATTFKFYTVEIPCADTSVLDPDDRSHADIGDASVVDAFVAAFEAFALTPDGNAPHVNNITLVGRNV